MDDPEKQIAEFLSLYEEAIRYFARALRTYLKAETKLAYELAGKSVQSFNISYGFTTTT